MDVVRFRRVGFESTGAARENLAVYTSRLLALLSLPVALVVLVRMLLGLSLLYPAIVGILAVLVATAFGTYQYLRGTMVAVLVYEDSVAVETALSFIRSRQESPRSWLRVLDLKGTGDQIAVVIGLDTYTFDRKDWHGFDSLRDALERARIMSAAR